MSTLKKFLCIVLSIALVAGVAALSAGAIRAESPAGLRAAPGDSAAPWWQSLPGFVQFILRYLCFGWLWMRPAEVTQPTTAPPATEEPTFSDTWPDNEFTRQVLTPNFEVGYYVIGKDDFSIQCSATIPELRDYVSELKVAGFTQNASTVDESIFGMSIYSYEANNGKGYRVEVTHAMGIGVISITKM